jgi:hypothetical protein
LAPLKTGGMTVARRVGLIVLPFVALPLTLRSAHLPWLGLAPEDVQ